MTEPSVFAYPSAESRSNTPLYLRDQSGEIVPLGSIRLTEEWQTFKEATTGRPVHLRRADCGLGCRCAAEYRIDES